jgi:hypothetical protein
MLLATDCTEYTDHDLYVSAYSVLSVADSKQIRVIRAIRG